MFIKLTLIAVVLISLGMLAMGLRMLVQKGSKFPNSSVSANPHLRKMGIRCARCEELSRYKKLQKKAPVVINPNKLKITSPAKATLV
jgi:hypothetical protein